MLALGMIEEGVLEAMFHLGVIVVAMRVLVNHRGVSSLLVV